MFALTTVSFALRMMLLNGLAFSVRVLEAEMAVQLLMTLLDKFIVPAILMLGDVRVIVAPVLFAVSDILAFELEAVIAMLHVLLFRFRSPPNLL